MAWIVTVILLLFYVVGTYAFHETSVIRWLPYVAALVLIIDFLIARGFKRKESEQK
ncbi:MAG: hypothetical protein ACXW18_06815 [Pyrinomonadaceae bacterium]